MAKQLAWTALLATCLTVPALAEDVAQPDADSAAESLSDVLPTTAYLSDWLLDNADLVTVGDYSTERVTPFDVDFEGGSAIERLSRFRALSFVTFGEMQGARLFLGVNADGYLGLHLYATPKDDDDPSTGLIRMPYLDGRDPLLAFDAALAISSR